MITRSYYLRWLEKAVNRSPIVSILGPQQIGKTTLARQFASNRETVFLIWNGSQIAYAFRI